jgi:hypothetical protein
MNDDDRALLQEEFAATKIGNRTDSAAMLAWFLANVERLEPEQIPDAICDGASDKGIDAITVDDDLREITLYQGKRMQSATKTQGDNDLKQLVAASEYFMSTDTVEGLLASKPNLELRRLLLRNDIPAKITEGYRVKRLVYVTNAPLDAAAKSYIEAMATREPTLEVWHGDTLAAVAQRVRRAELKTGTVEVVASTPPLIDDLDGTSELAVAIVPATELVKLPGIDDFTLFSRNVRLSAGNTRINKELAATIADPAEHPLFIASHNGITILTLGIRVDGSTITLDGASVVNGCQSLLALYRGTSHLTDRLKILTKIVLLPDARSELSDKITYRANNQNAVNIRDQRSTDPIQLDLQRQVAGTFDKAFTYLVKVGESAGSGRTLDNTLAAQLIMATYRERPFAAVRKVRLFDQDYHDVFARDINAHKLFLLQLIGEAVDAARDDLHGELRSSFASVRFTLAHLIMELLKLTPRGQQLADDPGRWLPVQTDEVLAYLTGLARDVARNVNDYVTDVAKERAEAGEDFDPKTVFKSITGVTPLRREVLTVGRRIDGRDPGFLFAIQPGGDEGTEASEHPDQPQVE